MWSIPSIEEAYFSGFISMGEALYLLSQLMQRLELANALAEDGKYALARIGIH